MKKYSVLKSRKFWAAVVGVLYSFLAVYWPDFPVPEESITGVVTTLACYMIGVAVEDGLSR